MQTFRPHRADDQGNEAPPPDPLPSSLCSVFKNRESVASLKSKPFGNKRRREKFLGGKTVRGILEAHMRPSLLDARSETKAAPR